MPNWKKLIVSGSSAELSTLKLTGLSSQGSETTSLMINGSNVIGTRDLGSNAFTSTTIPTNNNQLTNGAGYTTNTGTVTSVSVGTGLDVSNASSTPSITLDLSELTDMTGGVDSDETELILLDNGTESRKAIGEIALSHFSNDSGFTTNTGDITQVNITAGDGLTGDVNTTSGAHTQTIDVDSTVVRTSGTQTVGGSKTFSSETTFTAGIQLNDSDVITLGTGNDYEILDDGTDTLFRGRRHEGKLYFQMENDGGTLQNAIILGSSGSANDVGVELRYNNVGRIWTTSDGSAILKPSLMGLSSQASEATALMINGSNVVGTRELGSNAFNSTAFTTNTGTVTSVTINTAAGLDGGGSAITTSGTVNLSLDLSELTDMTADVVGDEDELILLDNGAERRKQINEIKLSQFDNDSGFTTNTGDITGVTAGVGLSGGGSSGGVTLTLDLSELSEVTPASGDALATLDSDGSTEQLTTVDALATLFAGGNGLAASSGVISVSGNLTGITSIYNTALSVGRGATNAALHFDTDETMMFAANNETQLLFKDGVVEPNTDNNYDLGSSSKEFKDLYIDGTAYIDAINFNGTAISATASEINLIDGGTARGTTAVSEGDGFLHNDAGTMRMTNVSKLADLFAGTGLSASEGVLSTAAAQTNISSILNTSLKVGRANASASDHEYIDFSNNSRITLSVDGGEARWNGSAFIPGSNNDKDLGSVTKKWRHLHMAGSGSFDSHLMAHCLGIGTSPSGTQGEIRATNDITAYYSSDIRLKENIHSLKGTLEKLDSIRAVTYDWKELTEEERKTVHSHTGSDIGVIAQEVEEVFPHLVEDRPNGYKAVNYEKLSAVLLSAVKELKQEVEELKQKIK